MIDWARYLPAQKPKYLAIKKMVINLLEQGLLSPGEPLPAERWLATQLTVNRSTVTRAFDELTTDGILVRRVGSGTFVSQQAGEQQAQRRVNWHTYLTSQPFQVGQVKGQALQQLIAQQPADLMPQFQFPPLTWQDFNQAQEAETRLGYAPLLTAINRLNQENQKLVLPEGQLLLTAGAQQSLFLVLQGLLVPGDAVAVESPSFFHEATLFEATGIRSFGAPLDAEGIQLAALEQLIVKHRVKLVILNPNYQNPTGQVMSLERRQAVIRLCQTYQVPIVEDDVFGWLRFETTPALPTLKQLDPENVIYMSSLSKIMGASTRIGWVAATPQVIDQLVRVQREMDLVPSIMSQVMAALAIQEPHFQTQLVTLRQQLQTRARQTQRVLARALPNWQFSVAQGGFYIWGTRAVKPYALAPFVAAHVALAPGTLFGAHQAAFRINFARLNVSQLMALAQRLQRLLNEEG
ncbi:PLP-dependent aminotransferase family protein [Latilactobacillus sakei]|uniref:aminotransferase-like domain-containing protein n=1 Tax=Latilactobacillus sakei TaxID=1599 RepID=UPI00202E5CEA|nr:PLP-dependent aminotransferase family protein [Latilactobacillus sakei]MCM1597448.1 PLP-dependent aminotransferase family protein [Latilactobacillus sakei]